MPKRLFIIGCPRSGTTWTNLLLAQHPQVQAMQQIGAISSLHKFRLLWERGEFHTRYHSSVISFPNAGGADGSVPRYEPLMSRENVIAIGRSMLDQVFALAAARKPSADVLLDSTPENALTPELMVELMPDAYFLHVIRDPRAVYASHRKGSEDFGAHFPTDPEGSAHTWREFVSKARKLESIASHYREVRYESLKRNGAEELTGILEWLGLDVDPEWVNRVVSGTTVEALQKTVGTPKSFFRSGKAEGWRKEVSRGDLHAIEYQLRDLMIPLGYEPVVAASTRRSAGMVLRRAARLVTTPLRRLSGA